MDKVRDALESFYRELEYSYEKALQSEGDKRIAFLEGELSGVRKSLEAIEKII